MSIRVADFIAAAAASPFAHIAEQPPWAWTQNAEAIVGALVTRCGDGYTVAEGVARHDTAQVEAGAAIKPPALIGPACFVASTALVRGGCWLDARCIIGPAAELKTTFMFAGSKLAHLNFVGDSVIGGDVNIEAGAMIANYRNERADKRIRIRLSEGAVIDTGAEKFGVLAGDRARIGANAVIAPGALLPPGAIVPRLTLIDQG